MGFSRQEYWTGLPFPSPGDLPDPGIKPRSPSLQADSLLPESPGKPQLSLTCPGALFFHAHHQRNCLTEPYNCWSTLERHGCTRRLPLDSQTTSLQRARVREGFLHAAGCRAALPVVCVPRGQFCHLTVTHTGLCKFPSLPSLLKLHMNVYGISSSAFKPLINYKMISF